jgi:hypothetical protein
MVAGLRLFLKAEIKHAGISYEELAARLMDRGLKENSASHANKLAGGTFSSNMVSCMACRAGDGWNKIGGYLIAIVE